MRAILAALLVTWAAPAFAECASGYTQVSVPLCQQNTSSNFKVGYTTTPTAGAGNNYTAGYNFANGPYTMPQDGTIQSCSVWLASSPSGQMQCGIYSAISSSQPGTLLAASAQFTPVAGWNTVPTTTNPSVTSGTSIFMGAIDTVSNQTLADSNSGFNLYGDNDSETTLQSTFLNPAHLDASTFQLGAYATFSPGAAQSAFFVATNGNDSNPGTLAQPFLTLAKAQSAMRASVQQATLLTRQYKKPSQLAPGFYVAPGGSDSNPGTLVAPFATLGKAQTAMLASGAILTTYIRAGSYAPAGLSACNSRGNCAIGMTSADNGETWSYYPPDGIGSAVITGGSTASGNGLWAIFHTGGATNITINGLSMQNFDYAAVIGGGSTGLTVTNNIISNGFGIVGDSSLTGAQNAAGIQCYACANMTVSHNVVHDIASFGISVSPNGSSGSISNLVYSGNSLYNICTTIRDCGALYTQDLVATPSTNLKMVNNYVRDGVTFSGTSGGWGSSIYLDDCASNWTITGNVLAGNNGTNNIMVHGGANNSITGNLIDLDALNNPVARFQSSSCATVTGNTFENSIIISNGTAGGYNGTSGNITVTNNAYHNYGSGTLSSTGDANPTSEDPQLTCWAYHIASGSPVFSSPVSFPGLPGAWGPPGFAIPQTGTVPSSPHTC